MINSSGKFSEKSSVSPKLLTAKWSPIRQIEGSYIKNAMPSKIFNYDNFNDPYDFSNILYDIKRHNFIENFFKEMRDLTDF